MAWKNKLDLGDLSISITIYTRQNLLIYHRHMVCMVCTILMWPQVDAKYLFSGFSKAWKYQPFSGLWKTEKSKIE